MPYVVEYGVAEVEALLSLAWEPTRVAWGVQNEHAPDRDMPRAKANPSHGNSLAAEVADIKRAWTLTPLTLKERRCLLLIFGLCYTQEMVEELEGAAQQVISRRKCRAVDKLVAFLNGSESV